jgi:hypothetical protein
MNTKLWSDNLKEKDHVCDIGPMHKWKDNAK